MHISFNHKGVAPPTQGCAALFYENVALLDLEGVDFVQQFRRKQTNIVDQRLIGIVVFKIRAMSQQLRAL